MAMLTSSTGRAFSVVALIALVSASVAVAQSGAVGDVYRVGVGDVLRLAVPQAPTLDSEETVELIGYGTGATSAIRGQIVDYDPSIAQQLRPPSN